MLGWVFCPPFQDGYRQDSVGFNFVFYFHLERETASTACGKKDISEGRVSDRAVYFNNSPASTFPLISLPMLSHSLK